MKLGKRYQQLINQWVEEILQKYPQVKYEGVRRVPEEGGVAIKLRGPEDILMLILHEYANRQIEALRKYRCDILFEPISEPPIDPNWPDWEIWDRWKFEEGWDTASEAKDEVKVSDKSQKGGRKNGESY